MKQLTKSEKIGAKYALSLVRSSLTRQLKTLEKDKLNIFYSKSDLARIDVIQYELDNVRDDIKELAEKIGV